MNHLLASTIAGLVVLSLPVQASYREHKHFKPPEAGAVAKELIARLKLLHDRSPDAVHARMILTKGTDVGVGMFLKDTGQICLLFDLALEKKREGYIDSSQDGLSDRRTVGFRVIKKPAVRWHLSAQAVEKFEQQLDTPALRVSGFGLRHQIVYSEEAEVILQSSSTLTVEVWTVEEAVALVNAYYSDHPDDTPLWEDG